MTHSRHGPRFQRGKTTEVRQGHLDVGWVGKARYPVWDYDAQNKTFKLEFFSRVIFPMLTVSARMTIPECKTCKETSATVEQDGWWRSDFVLALELHWSFIRLYSILDILAAIVAIWHHFGWSVSQLKMSVIDYSLKIIV